MTTLPYHEVRRRTEALAAPLSVEDQGAQPVANVSPPKWHLAHTTWYFETFVLQPFLAGYRTFDPHFSFLFNSYYEGVGVRVRRDRRGTLTRPTVDRVYDYRRAVDEAVGSMLERGLAPEVEKLAELGLHHEQQHQELLVTDLKYILGTQPTHPAYGGPIEESFFGGEPRWLEIPEGVHDIGFDGAGFSFDNERPRHRVYLNGGRIRTTLVRNEEYLEFVRAGGYRDFRHWHADGWAWVNREGIEAPLYWRPDADRWLEYTLHGLRPLDPDDAVCHVSFYEAAAFAAWRGLRLPTEQEWEVLADELGHGGRWEWTDSAYLPYPGFAPEPGAVGEYNGKFMVNQMVLRGYSVATPPGHERRTYRNFFYPHERWQYTGIRLAE